MKKDESNYKNWFVIHVKTGREFFIRDYIEKNMGEYVKVLAFSRELIFCRQGDFFKVNSSLFPGYFFVHQKTKQVIDFLRTYLASEYIKPVCFKQKKCKICFTQTSPCMVYEHEMKYLLDNSDSHGLFRLSAGYESEGEVVITNGPIKDLYKNILWINRKKKKACVEIELFRRKLKVNLGIDVFRKQEAV